MNKNELKEVKIFLEADVKDWLQKLAKEQGKPFRTFIVDSLIQQYETSYLEKELMKIKNESSVIRKSVVNLKAK